MTGGRWQVQSRERVDAAHWSAWDALNVRHHADHPVLRSTMIALLAEHFGSPQLRFAAYRVAGEVQAMALLAPDGFGRWVVFCPSQAPLAAIVGNSALGLQPFRDLLGKLSLTSLRLQVPHQDPMFWPWDTRTAGVEWDVWGRTISVVANNGFDEYWNARPSDLRQNLRRYRRRAETDGLALRETNCSQPADVAAAVDRYGLLESAGWKGKEGTALHPENQQGRFYRALLTAFANEGRARVFELYASGDRLIASRMLLSGPTMHVMLKTTYDEAFSRNSVGRILLQHTLSVLLGESARRVEFYTQANDDMLSWASESREIGAVGILRNRGAETVLRAVRRWRARGRPAEAPAQAGG
jgi:hypothetical protein